MPSASEIYSETIFRFRGRMTNGVVATTDRVLATYDDIIARLLAETQSGNVFTKTRAAQLIESVRESLAEFGAEAERVIANGAAAARQLAVDGHLEALEKLQSGFGKDLTTSFARVPVQAVERLVDRSAWAQERGMAGFSSYFQTVIRAGLQDQANVLDRLITSGVGAGTNSRAMTREVARFLAGDDDRMVQTLQLLGPRGGLTRLGRQVSPEVLAGLPRAGATNLLRRAELIAIHELNSAYHEADAAAAAASPVVHSVKWTLSGRHQSVPSSPDACDILAAQDAYGLGKGVYPADVVPPLAHPRCLCSTQKVLLKPKDWGNKDAKPHAKDGPMGSPRFAKMMSEKDGAKILKAGTTTTTYPGRGPKLTQRYIARQTHLANTQTQEALGAVGGNAQPVGPLPKLIPKTPSRPTPPANLTGIQELTGEEVRKRIVEASARAERLMRELSDRRILLGEEKVRITNLLDEHMALERPLPTGERSAGWKRKFQELITRNEVNDRDRAILTARKARIKEAAEKRALRILAREVDPAEFAVEHGKGFKTMRGKRRPRFEKAQDWFRRVIGKDNVPEGALLKTHGYGGYRSRYGMDLTIEMSADAPVATYIHEMGHWLEHVNPRISQAAKDFVKMRAGDERPSWLGRLRGGKGLGYGKAEVAIEDSFINAYMGRSYPTVRTRWFGAGDPPRHWEIILGETTPTEIFSMGLQYLAERPTLFAAQDPKMFDFIIDVLRGHYNPKNVKNYAFKKGTQALAASGRAPVGRAVRGTARELLGSGLPGSPVPGLNQSLAIGVSLQAAKAVGAWTFEGIAFHSTFKGLRTRFVARLFQDQNVTRWECDIQRIADELNAELEAWNPPAEHPRPMEDFVRYLAWLYAGRITGIDDDPYVDGIVY